MTTLLPPSCKKRDFRIYPPNLILNIAPSRLLDTRNSKWLDFFCNQKLQKWQASEMTARSIQISVILPPNKFTNRVWNFPRVHRTSLVFYWRPNLLHNQVCFIFDICHVIHQLEVEMQKIFWLLEVVTTYLENSAERSINLVFEVNELL